jgi:hypothetical protein
MSTSKDQKSTGDKDKDEEKFKEILKKMLNTPPKPQKPKKKKKS